MEALIQASFTCKSDRWQNLKQHKQPDNPPKQTWGWRHRSNIDTWRLTQVIHLWVKILQIFLSDLCLFGEMFHFTGPKQLKFNILRHLDRKCLFGAAADISKALSPLGSSVLFYVWCSSDQFGSLKRWVGSQRSSWRLQRTWWCELRGFWLWSLATGTQVTEPYSACWPTCNWKHRNRKHIHYKNTTRVNTCSGDPWPPYLFRWLSSCQAASMPSLASASKLERQVLASMCTSCRRPPNAPPQ